jgi:hypothetical protein
MRLALRASRICMRCRTGKPVGRDVSPIADSGNNRLVRLSSGAQLFARYAYSPNELGYCGPADASALFELAATGQTEADVVALAKRFSGVWPYLSALAGLAGIEDPLDEGVVRAYWIGGPLLDSVDRESFGARLLADISKQAGHYWAHLNADLLPEATATHAFHVLGVYPWSRLLTAGSSEQPLHVLDRCRIRWGQVLEIDHDHAITRSRRLIWDGERLELARASEETVRVSIDGLGFVPDAAPGDWLALHWDWACDRLTTADLAQLRQRTRWQLQVTNKRLSATEPPDAS